MSDIFFKGVVLPVQKVVVQPIQTRYGAEYTDMCGAAIQTGIVLQYIQTGVVYPIQTGVVQLYRQGMVQSIQTRYGAEYTGRHGAAYTDQRGAEYTDRRGAG